MTETTISEYKEGGAARIAIFGLIYLICFSGLTMLGWWVFQFSDTTDRLNLEEGKKTG